MGALEECGPHPSVPIPFPPATPIACRPRRLRLTMPRQVTSATSWRWYGMSLASLYQESAKPKGPWTQFTREGGPLVERDDSPRRFDKPVASDALRRFSLESSCSATGKGVLPRKDAPTGPVANLSQTAVVVTVRGASRSTPAFPKASDAPGQPRRDMGYRQ